MRGRLRQQPTGRACPAAQGSDPPLAPDGELPDWLWKLAEQGKTLNELKRIKEEDLTFEEVRWRAGPVPALAAPARASRRPRPPTRHPPPCPACALQLQRLVKLENRHGIRTRNASRAK